MKENINRIDDGLQELLSRANASSAQPAPAETSKIVSKHKTNELKRTNYQKKQKDRTTKDDKSNKVFLKLTGWDDNVSFNASLRSIIGGDILAGQWFHRHFKFLFALVLLTIVYVTNRYGHQNEMIDNRKLTLALEDRRLRSVVARSNLTEYMRRSNILKNLPDSTLKPSPSPFYYLQTK